MNERQKEEYRRLTNQPDKMDFTGDEHIPPGTNRQPFSKTSDEVAFPCGHTVAHEEDCPRCEVERLRRELGLKDALIDALTDCIGPEDGQTFEERAEELIVTEVAYQNSRAAPETNAPLSASDRLHNLCDALSEQAGESPFTREEWNAVDNQTVRLQNALRGLIDAVRNLEIDKGPWDSFVAKPLESAYRALRHEDPLTGGELKAFVQLCAPHGQDWLTCPECAKAAGIEEAR